MMNNTRPIRPPPHARRELFSRSRRQDAHSSHHSKQDIGAIYSLESSQDDELVEKDANGNFLIRAPQGLYKPAGMRSREEEESEQENQLIEFYGKRSNHCDVGDAMLDEIRAALKSSLDKKAASLEEDRWMFEGESKGRN